MRSPEDERIYKARHDGERKPEDIETEIASTRAEMNSTLDAIQRKLSPGQIVDQALSYMRSGPGEFASNFADTVKRNPLPVALLGISLGWLMMWGRSGGNRDYYTTEASSDYYAPEAEGYIPEESRSSKMRGMMQSARDKVGAALGKAGDTAGSAQQRMSDMAHGARETAGQAAGSVRTTAGHVASGMRSRASQLVSGMRDRSGRLASGARHSAQRARGGIDYMLNEQPLLLGAIGLAIGAALGAALPSTRREDELMGRKRDELLRQAEETGREQMHKAGRMAEAAAEAAKEEAGRQDMS